MEEIETEVLKKLELKFGEVVKHTYFLASSTN